MITGLTHLHSALRWVALILLVITVIGSFTGGSTFTEGARKRGLFTMITLHVQLVVGLALYFLGQNGVALFKQADVMSDPMHRFFAVEHLTGMLVAILFATLGHSLAKRAGSDRSKYRKQQIWFTFALILIVASIPWPFRPGFEAYGWF